METIGGLAVLISLAFFVNVIIRLYKHLRKVDGIDVKTTLKRVAIAVGLFIVGGALIGVADDGVEVAEEEMKEEKEAVKEKKVDVTSEKDIEKVVNELLGDTSNAGEKRIEKGVYSEGERATH